MFALRFLKKQKFDSYDDYLENAIPNVPEHFNFAYDVIDVLGNQSPDTTALIWTNDSGERRTFTFRDLSIMSGSVANFLRSRGINRGDTVLLFMRRRWEYWILMMAMHKLGAIPIPSTNQLKTEDIRFRINAAECKNIIAFDDGHIVNEIQSAIGERNDIQMIDCMEIDDAIEKYPSTIERVPNENDDTMVIYFTSGTTDMPKMVVHNYAYPLGHINTAIFWQRLHDGDIHYTLSESGWAKCSWGKMYGQWLAGAIVFVFDFSGVLTAHDLLTAISENRVTSFCAPPTVYKMMLHADMSKYDLSALVKADVAGEALNPEVYEHFLENTGIKMREGFGQTETCIMLFNNPWIEPKPGSMGKPSPTFNIDIVDDDGNPCEDGKEGNLIVRMPNGKKPTGLFCGYYKSPDKTQEVWHDNMYFTGDVVYKDEDGYFWFVGRADDVIKSSGYRIGPFEVESALMEHPAVLECAITAVPDPVRGQVVKATIVLAKGYHASDSLVVELQNHVKNVTAPYKYPRVVEFVDELPKTISGKIRKVAIREADKVKHSAK